MPLTPAVLEELIDGNAANYYRRVASWISASGEEAMALLRDDAWTWQLQVFGSGGEKAIGVFLPNDQASRFCARLGELPRLADETAEDLQIAEGDEHFAASVHRRGGRWTFAATSGDPQTRIEAPAGPELAAFGSQCLGRVAEKDLPGNGFEFAEAWPPRDLRGEPSSRVTGVPEVLRDPRPPWAEGS